MEAIGRLFVRKFTSMTFGLSGKGQDGEKKRSQLCQKNNLITPIRRHCVVLSVLTRVLFVIGEKCVCGIEKEKKVTGLIVPVDVIHIWLVHGSIECAHLKVKSCSCNQPKGEKKGNKQRRTLMLLVASTSTPASAFLLAI